MNVQLVLVLSITAAAAGYLIFKIVIQFLKKKKNKHSCSGCSCGDNGKGCCH